MIMQEDVRKTRTKTIDDTSVRASNTNILMLSNLYKITVVSSKCKVYGKFIINET